jgi:hypothetical protein
VTRTVTIILAGAGAVALMVAAFWTWQWAPDWASDMQPQRPEVLTWALRSLALGAAALAQFLIMRVIERKLFRRAAVDDAVCLASAVACAIALVSATALALAAR